MNYFSNILHSVNVGFMLLINMKYVKRSHTEAFIRSIFSQTYRVTNKKIHKKR